jgi:predicted Zn-dependent protease
MQQRSAALRRRLAAVIPAGADWTLRVTEAHRESVKVRQNLLQPFVRAWTGGALLTLVQDGGLGYAATADLSPRGLERAADQASRWARAVRGLGVVDPAIQPLPGDVAEYRGPAADDWAALPLGTRVEIVHDACTALAQDRRIVDWSACVHWERVDSLLLSSAGGCLQQSFSYLVPGLAATANVGAETQKRSVGWTIGRQGGLEQMAQLGFPGAALRIAAEAVALLEAPNCPSGRMDLILTPSQMALQIHESIGHPLELDRILGDERNYAGTSFVTPDMFGHYRYGSELLNVTFDPSRPEQLASYGYDDDGTRAERVFLIRSGLLERPLGGALSQHRAGLPGTANARTSSWNRPPIDRMANINLEPGDSSLEQLIGRVERGVLMDTNRSWSIDDSRNKFQFGCEYARLIRDGELREVVRNPSYRGISARFWRGLAGVGDRDSLEVLGVTNCGKGEPNQSIYVGHASPPCLFRGVSVFGGED